MVCVFGRHRARRTRSCFEWFGVMTMRLKIPMASANENMVALINHGYSVLASIKQAYSAKKQAGTYSQGEDNSRYSDQINEWVGEVVAMLERIFPTELECNLFLNPEIPFGAVSGDHKYQSLIRRFSYFIRGLE